MARRTAGERSDEREQVATDVDEALVERTELYESTITEHAERTEAYESTPYEGDEMAGSEVGAEPLGGYESEEASGGALLAERAGAQRKQSSEAATGADTERRGWGARLGGLIHRGVYSGFYGVSFGVVFGALLVSRLVPADSAMAEGVRDGAEAARHALESGLNAESTGGSRLANPA